MLLLHLSRRPAARLLIFELPCCRLQRVRSWELTEEMGTASRSSNTGATVVSRDRTLAAIRECKTAL